MAPFDEFLAAAEEGAVIVDRVGMVDRADQIIVAPVDPAAIAPHAIEDRLTIDQLAEIGVHRRMLDQGGWREKRWPPIHSDMGFAVHQGIAAICDRINHPA